ncbi:MAG TPA: efflux RND transporter periplasmic adaptor subunit [Myxococcota bacterium]|jgi:membrane fusion protein (multidrug efflux system)|nr:efflux RND transporter periplasmic adaptor subunit [Myxococcota bacterium]
MPRAISPAVRRFSPSLAAVLPAVAAVVAVSGCSRSQPPPPPPPEVLVTPVVQQDVPLHAEWVGTMEGFVNAQVMPRVQGYLLEQRYQDGSQVTAGQLLFEIDDRPYRAALDKALGELAEAQATLRKHQLDVARYQPLVGEGAVSREELDNAVQASRAGEAQVKAAEAAVTNARLDLDWTRVYSPIDGIAGIAPVQLGDLVTPSTVLTTVSQVDPMKVTFPITEREYIRVADRIKEHEGGQLEDEPVFHVILADGSAYPHPGQFYAADRAVDRERGTIRMQALFPNPDATLRPGQYARVRAVVDTLRSAVVVPERAVQELQGVDQVAVVGSDDKVTLRTVTAGVQQDGLWVIDAGLRPGERVVTEGLQKVKDGIAVSAKPDPSAAPAPAAAPSPPPGEG